MSFLAPLMLIGAVAGGIPIALHFFYRSRYRTVPWAAMKFLLTSIEQTSRRLRFQELLLLILRVVLLCLLALALARPATRLASASAASDAVDAVFLIDVSMSMDALAGSGTRLEQAKEAALNALAHLPPYSTVQVIAVTDQARILGPTAPSNLDHARYLIDELMVTHRSTDFLPALQEAEAVLQRGQSPNKELYLFSDMHKLGWDRQGTATQTKLRELSEQAAICLVRCGQKELRNLTLAGLEVQSALPHAGERAAFTILVRNTGTDLLRDVSIALELDGQRADADAVLLSEIIPGETRPVSVTARLPRAGLMHAAATASADGLASDNRFDRLIQVHDLINVLIVDGSPNTREPEKSASYFFAHALRPVPEMYWDRYHVRPRIVPPAQLSAESLDGVHAVFFANVSLQPGSSGGTPPPEFLARLGEFVRGGGTLAIFGGPNVADGARRLPEAYNRVLIDELGLSPVRVVEAERVPSERSLRLDPTSADATGPFAKFRTEPLDAISQVEILQYLKVEPLRDAGGKPVAETLLRFTNGAPAVLLRAVGDGHSVLVTTSADQQWTDWPIRQTFLPFVHVLLSRCLHGEARQHELRAGEPLRFRLPAGETGQMYGIQSPDGSKSSPRAAEFQAGHAWLRGSEADRAGLYRAHPQIQPEQSRRPAHEHLLAVTPDLREFEDLTAYSDAELDEWLGFTPVHASAGDDLQDAIASVRLRHEWTVWLLVIVLLLTLGEAVLAWWCGRGW